jgi:hypothetical protein
MSAATAERQENVVEVASKKRLSAADILGANDVHTVDVEVPEWGGFITLRTLTAGEAILVSERLKSGQRDAAIQVLAMCAVDSEGNLLFTEEDVIRLRSKSLKAVMRVQDAALKLNGMKEAQAERDAAKNV